MEALHQLVEACSTCEELLQNDLRMLDEVLKQGQCAVSEYREKETLAS